MLLDHAGLVSVQNHLGRAGGRAARRSPWDQVAPIGAMAVGLASTHLTSTVAKSLAGKTWEAIPRAAVALLDGRGVVHWPLTRVAETDPGSIRAQRTFLILPF